MRTITAVVLVIMATIAYVKPEDTKYTTKYDNIDLQEILKSDRLFNNYFGCVMDRGSCTPDGAELKKHIKEALQDKCAKCSENQKKGSRIVLLHLIKERRPKFDELAAKYDPEGLHKQQYQEELKKEGITL